MTRIAKSFCLLVASLAALPLYAGPDDEPVAMRKEALTEGRDFSYNTEAFLNRLSFQLPSWEPELQGDGVQGTGGSTETNRLALNMFVEKTLRSDSGLTELTIRAQRLEDFDGYDTRFIVGLGRYLTPSFKVSLLGDIYGDKAESDIYFESEWSPNDDRYLRAGLVLPDYYYNSKHEGDNSRYEDEPQTWYLHYREQRAEDWFTEFMISYSPEASFDDPDDGLFAAGDQTILRLGAGAMLGQWQTSIRATSEWVNRDFVFNRTPAPLEDDFTRRAYSCRIETHAPAMKYWPRFGVRHFYLDEEGWFGDARDISGKVFRREPTAYAGCSVEFTDNGFIEPVLYLGWADIKHEFDDPAENRDEEKVIGKLALNARFVLNEKTGAYITIAPTFYLHRSRFGGGNIRIVWPF